MNNFVVKGRIVDILQRKIYSGSVHVREGKIDKIVPEDVSEKNYIMPGFTDSHVHIESSMLTPQNLGWLTVSHGTVAVVTDPHEIANVMGIKGINFMIENGKKSPLKLFFTVPSCVPSTPFDVSGDVVTSADVKKMLETGKFVGLSEMMNVPGVLGKDSEVMAKLQSAKDCGLPIDGHAPGLSGDALLKYVKSGITNDHECSNLKEAEEKLSAGMKIIIREGSAARNYEPLKSLIRTDPKDVMFCTDDSHPDDIIHLGHIDKIVRMAVGDGFDLFDVLKIACLNPVKYYNLKVGTLQKGDYADFIVVKDLHDFKVQQNYINGIKVFDAVSPDKRECIVADSFVCINKFNHERIAVSELKKEVKNSIIVISLTDGELLTAPYEYQPEKPLKNMESDIKNDILKIVYINRYSNGTPQVSFIKGFHLKKGAIASSVAHDSHNILSVGCSDGEIAEAINRLIEEKGGLTVSFEGKTYALPLPVGGIMSDKKGDEVAARYSELCDYVRQMGCNLRAPFMTLSFMSLVVIPEIKVGEKGLFSYSKFNWLKE